MPPIESVLDSVKRKADEALLNRKNGTGGAKEEEEMEEEEKGKEGEEKNEMEAKRLKVERMEEAKGETVNEIVDISEREESIKSSSSDESLDSLLEKRGNEDPSKPNQKDEMDANANEESSSDSENVSLAKIKPIDDPLPSPNDSENDLSVSDSSDSSSDSDEKPLVNPESAAIPSHPTTAKANQFSDSESSASDNEPLLKLQPTSIQPQASASTKKPLLSKTAAPHPNASESDSSEDDPILAFSSSILPLSSSVPSASPPKIAPPSAAKAPLPRDPIDFVDLDDDVSTSTDSDDLPIIPAPSKSPKRAANPMAASENRSAAPKAPLDTSTKSKAPLETSAMSSVTVSAVSLAPKPVSRDTTNTSSSNSSLLIPVFRSTLESQQPPLPDFSGQPDYPTVKPPPLSREVINELFPRSKMEAKVEEKAPPKIVEKSSVVCPLCLALCEDAESLRRHINTTCAMLPTPLQSVAINSKPIDANRMEPQRSRTPIQSPLRARQTPIHSPLRTKQNPVQSPLKDRQTPIQSPLRAALAPIRYPPSTNHAMLSPSTSANVNLNANLNGNSNAYMNGNSNGNGKKNSNVNSNTNTDTNANANVNSNANPSATVDTHSHPNPQTNTLSTAANPTAPPILPSAAQSAEALKQEVKDFSSISLATNSTINGSDLGINLEDLDLFEKELAATAEPRPAPSAPPQICSICRDASQDESNPLLCCQSCKVLVHASCYGLAAPPASPWKCDVASLSLPLPLELRCRTALRRLRAVRARRGRDEAQRGRNLGAHRVRDVESESSLPEHRHHAALRDSAGARREGLAALRGVRQDGGRSSEVLRACLLELLSHYVRTGRWLSAGCGGDERRRGLHAVLQDALLPAEGRRGREGGHRGARSGGAGGRAEGHRLGRGAGVRRGV